VVAASTRKGVEKAAREGIAFHLEGLRAEGMTAPRGRGYDFLILIERAANQSAA